MDRTVKIVNKHNIDCHALKNQQAGTWKTCWGPLAFGRWGEPVVIRVRKYGKNGKRYKKWLRFICNDINCHAELHVDCDFVLAQAIKYGEKV